jgi:nicotinamidase-related amidase
VVSTWGHGIAEPLKDALRRWRSAGGRAVRYIFKGENPFTEQFSIFEGLDDRWPECAFNETLFSRLADRESVTFAGEALSHCVSASIASYMSRAKKGQAVYLLADCSSPVTGFNRDGCLAEIASLGVKIITGE